MTDTTKTSNASFSGFGVSFQEKLIQALLTDSKWAEQMTEVIDESYFDVKYLRFLADRYFTYAKKYKVFPTLPLLITIIKDELKVGTDAVLRDQIISYLTRMRANPDVGDLPYVKDKSLDFAKKQALKGALETAVDMMSAEKYESIVEEIKKAVSVGTASSIGHDFLSDIEARFVKISRNAVPTGLAELDKKGILNGGLGKGELGVIVAATGVGKSHFLTMLGAYALQSGRNVLHYTLELSENLVGIRYDSHLCSINSNDIIDSKSDVLQKYGEMKSLGRLIIKEFPTNTATIYTLRSHIEKLSVKGFRPDIILIDYADIMRSTRQYDSLRHELKLIYQELRGYANELGIPVWTASQSNKEGSQSDVIDLSNMSEAYGKAMEADVVLSISRKSHEKATGWGRLYVAKNRAGRDGIVYPIRIDTAQSKFQIVGEQMTPDAVGAESESDMKKALRQKWKELQREQLVSPGKVAESAAPATEPMN